jgi:integrase
MGHVKKREWLGGRALSGDAAKRRQQIREVTAKARSEGRKLAPMAVSYQARIPSPTNRHKDVVKTFARKRDAERWLTSQAEAINRGDFIDPRRGETLFEQVATEWQDTWADLAPKTQVGYQSILNRHVLPAFGKASVRAITPDDVQRFANSLATDHAANTLRRVMDVVRAVLRVAVERRYVAANPCDAVRLPRKGESRNIEINPMTHAEASDLLGALSAHWTLAVLLDAYTGLRAGELWALRRRDVSLRCDEITVDEAIKEVTRASAVKVPSSQRITDSLIVGPTKTYAKRKVSVPPFLRDMLKEHLAQPLPGGSGPEAFIFTTPTGEAVRHNLFYKRVFVPAARSAFPARTAAAERRAEAAGQNPKQASPLRFHDLRHTCAAWLIAAGAHPLQIKLRLGHKEIRTTMDIYGHLFPSAEPELADLLDAGYQDAQNGQDGHVAIEF